MAKLQFYALERKNPRTGQTPASKFYPQKATYTNISTKVLLRRITENTAVPAGVVRAAVNAIVDSVANFVCNGHSVKLGDLMSLRPTVQCRGAQSADAFKAENVERVMLRVAWGSNVVNLQKPEYYEWEKLEEKPLRHKKAE